MTDLTRLITAVARLMRAMPRNEIAQEIDVALKDAIKSGHRPFREEVEASPRPPPGYVRKPKRKYTRRK